MLQWSLRASFLTLCKGYKKKGSRSRSATASLLIKNDQCIKEEIKLIVFLAQKSRHILQTRVVSFACFRCAMRNIKRQCNLRLVQLA